MANTKQYDWTRFSLKIELAVPPERVFRAWTNASELSAWFAVTCEIEPRSGGRLFFEWLGGDRLETRIIAVKKNRELCFPFGPKGEQVRVHITKSRQGALCTLEQSGMLTSPGQKIEMHMGCKTGWVFFLTNLKAYLEHGVDLRSHDRRKSYQTGYINS
jgi:uncharacterized protein YndB with AHSA1/START domain